MLKTIESGAITPLLLILDKGEFAPTEFRSLSDEVSKRIVEITKDTEEVKALLESEKKKITERGDDISSYLFRNDTEIREVFETYYRGVVDKDKERKLSKRFTITEMMLILGVFTHFMTVRQTYLDGYKWNSRKLSVQRMTQKAKSKIKRGEASEDLGFIQNIVDGSRISEERMLSYLRNQSTVLINAILEELGTSLKDTSRKQLESILDDSQELCIMASGLSAYFEKRKEEGTPLYSDVALLDACGERHPDLYSILATDSYNSKGGKRK